MQFNGDSNNVTVFGESAGGAAVCSYLTSKMADGLYHKVIAQSGNSIADIFMIDQDPIEKARAVASNLGKDLKDERSLFEFLVDAPIEDLLIAFITAEMSRPPVIISSYFLPVPEKKFDGVERFFDEYPRIDIALNRYNKVPVLAGLNSHEGALFIQRDSGGNVIFEEDFFFFIPNYLKIKRGDRRVDEISKKIKQFYFGGRELDENSKSEYINMISDYYFNYNLMLMPELLSKVSVDVFFYKFKYFGNMNTRVMKNLGLKGASHGDMVQYQFYRKNKHEKCSEHDIKIVEMLSEAWCAFARNGKPSWKNQKTEWLPYTKNEKHLLIIDDDIKLVKNPDLDKLKFWLSVTGETSKL